MARHDEREAVARAERAGGALRPRMAGEPREVASRTRPLRSAHVAARRGRPAGKASSPRGRPRRRAKSTRLAREVGAEPVDEPFHFRRGPFTDTRPFRRYRRPRGRWVFHPTLGGGYSRARARTRACTWRRLCRRTRELVPDEPGCRRATPPPRPSPQPRTRRTSQTPSSSLQSPAMSAAPGLFRPRRPQNEPVKDYAPGTPEREELRERLEADARRAARAPARDRRRGGPHRRDLRGGHAARQEARARHGAQGRRDATSSRRSRPRATRGRTGIARRGRTAPPSFFARPSSSPGRGARRSTRRRCSASRRRHIRRRSTRPAS